MINAFRSIQLFLAVYEERSFTAAATRENATQPGISQHISSLEKSLGVKLFRRKRYDVSPTPAGDIFYRYCQEALRALDTARKAVRPFANSMDGEIIAGLSPTLSQFALPPAFMRFAAQYPNIRVSIQEFSGPVVRQHIRAGKLDFAVSPSFARPDGFKTAFFATIPEVLVRRRDDSLNHFQPVAPADLTSVKLVLPPRSYARRPTIEAYLNAHGARVEQIMEMNSLASLSLVDCSDWMTILPVTAVWSPAAFRDPHRSIHPLVDPPLALDWVVIEPYHKARSEAANLFVQYLESEARTIIEQWRSAANNDTAT